MQIEITDKHFQEAKSELEKQTIEKLRSIARRFNMKDSEDYDRTLLIEKIVQKIKKVMIEKYEPKSLKKLKQITDLLVESLISTPGNKKKKPSSKSAKSKIFFQILKFAIFQKTQNKIFYWIFYLKFFFEFFTKFFVFIFFHLATTNKKDPTNKLKIKNMAGRFKKNRKGETIKRKCRTCSLEFDNHIVRWPENQASLFECPSCIILNNDPLNQVVDILYEPSVLKSNKTYNFILRYENYNAINSDPRVGVEIRTLKLNGEHFYQQTWPDKCCIRVNGKIVKEIEPLNQNSSLKKRRDQKLFNRYMSRVGINAFNINYKNIKDGKNTKVDYEPIYVFAIVIVRKKTIDELSEDILGKCLMTEEDSREFIMRKFNKENGQNDLQISEIKADLLCKISFTYVKNPTRGEFCQHLDCFSLDFFLKSMEQNLVRRWICPLCRKRCLNLKVDKYFEKIIDDAKAKGDLQISRVFFKSDGGYTLEVDEFEHEDHENLQGLDFDQENKQNKIFEILSISTEERENDDRMLDSDDGMIQGRLIKPEILLSGNYGAQNPAQLLKKRPFEAVQTKRIKMEKNYRKDEGFLLNLWKHHEAQKRLIDKNHILKTFEEFRDRLLELCEIDIFFSKKLALLYKFVLIRRRENRNSIVMRYNRILDEVNGQPNWIYGLDDDQETFLRQNKILKIANIERRNKESTANKENEKEDTQLLKRILDDYNLDFDEEMSDSVVDGFKNGTSKTPIEII